MKPTLKRIFSAVMSAAVCFSCSLLGNAIADDGQPETMTCTEYLDILETGENDVQREDFEITENHNLYDFYQYNYKSLGTTDMTYKRRGAFDCTWKNTYDTAFMSGHIYKDESERSVLARSELYISYRAVVDAEKDYFIGALCGFESGDQIYIVDDWDADDLSMFSSADPVMSYENNDETFDVYLQPLNNGGIAGTDDIIYRYWCLSRVKKSENTKAFSSFTNISEHIEKIRELSNKQLLPESIMLDVQSYKSNGTVHILSNDIFYFNDDPVEFDWNNDNNENTNLFGEDDFPDTLNDESFYQDVTDERGGYYFHMFQDQVLDGPGYVKFDIHEGGKFDGEWTAPSRVTFERGIEYYNSSNTTRSVERYYNGEDLSIDYEADIESDGTVLAGAHGWLNQISVEYYIIDGWKDFSVSDEYTALGSVSIDDGVYDLYMKDRWFFKEYLSVRRENKLSDNGKIEGTIPVSKHLYAFVKYGLEVADPDYVSFCIEPREYSTGSAVVKKNIVRIDGVDIAVSAGFESQEKTDVPTEEEEIYIPGDLNNDLEVNSFDLIIARRELIKAVDGNDTVAEADVDCSGATKINDLILVTRLALGDEVAVPKTRPHKVK